MEQTFDKLVDNYRKILKSTNVDFVRSLMDVINWDARLIGIKGARGVGKTTILLQYIKLNLPNELNQTLYVSLDSFWFSQNSLIELADFFIKRGGKYLFLDEVHKYENWSQELKNIYDSYPELKVVFTGSSLLNILNARADLSRRAVVYYLQGLSFREYVSIETNQKLNYYKLDDIVKNHIVITDEILDKIKPFQYFNTYLKEGYYPFYKEEKELYHIKINEIVNMILEIELPLLRGIDLQYISKIKQLLLIIAQSVPFVPNVSKVSEKIGIQRATLLSYIHYLEEVKLTKNLFKKASGISKLQKPSKLYLENTNLMYAIAENAVNRGSLRESFFANQLSYNHNIQYSDYGDFLINETLTFEVGGKNKGLDQIKNLSNAYIVADDIEYGSQNKIPLWLFGFLY